MFCDKCGLPLLGTESFCPQCGAALKQQSKPGRPGVESQAEPADLEQEPEVIEADDIPVIISPFEPAAAPEPQPEPVRPVGRAPRAAPTQAKRGRLFGPMGMGMMAGCLVFVVVGLAVLGIWQGLRMRGQRQVDSAAKYYAQGVAYMEKGNYDLAIGAFEYALRLQPDYREAQQKLNEARDASSRQPTPTVQGGQGSPSSLLSQGRTAYDQGSWSEAIARLEALQAEDPTYEQATVRRLLVGAYTNEGVKLANEDRMEEAIRRFDQALALQPDNPDLEIQRRLATLYQSGLSAWEADWAQAITSFSALYTLKPGYKDTAQRLQRAYALAGDAAGIEARWCDAVEHYKAALTMASTPELAAKRDEAARNCASPTTPGAPAPSGTFVGTVAGQQPIQGDWGRVHGQVLNARSQPVGGVKVKISAYDWSAFTNTDGNGYYVFEALTGEITFTVALVDQPMQPVDVKVKPGTASTVDFQEKQ